MDYRITDAVTDPPVPADDWHCERLLRLPDTQWCFRPFGTPAMPGPLPAREAGFVTFGSFNNLTKASDTLLACWAQILVELPTSRLRLTRVRSEQRAAEIMAMFGRSGVAAERIECVAYAKDPPYGQQFAGVDIALDNYPYNGVTTTCESLYVGVPVVSLYGRNGVSRSGLSLLGALGLGELAASTPERYVEIAVALASDLPQARAAAFVVAHPLRAIVAARRETIRGEFRRAVAHRLAGVRYSSQRCGSLNTILKHAAIAAARLVQQNGAVQLAQFARDEQPKSGAALAARKKRLENAVDRLRLDARARDRRLQERVGCSGSGGRA